MWVRSARADAALTRHAAVSDIAHAFEMLYRANPDPYAAVDPRYRYQARKYATLLSFLPARHYGHVLDLGCESARYAGRLPHMQTPSPV